MEIKKKEKKSEPNIWLIVSIILAIALVGVLATTLKPNMFAGDKDNASDFIVISKEDASSKLVGFITEVYGAQIGTPTIKEVNEKYGMYEVKMSLIADGQPRDEVTFVTKDGKLFVPNVLIMEEALQQFRDWQTQQQQIQAEVPTGEQPTVTETEEEPAAE
jgi:hypothetical protein